MKPLNVLLLLGTLALLGANWMLRVDPAQRNVEIFPDMARAVSVQSFSGEMRPPVAGTIQYHTVASRPAAGAPALARGATVYANFCLPCHGPVGRGDGLVAQRGFPAPPSLLAANARKITDEQIFRILTFGQKNMPSYASQIDPGDRWRAIAYVRSLQAKEVK